MSDPISPAGSQGLAPAAALYGGTPAPAAPSAPKAGAGTPETFASAQTQAIQNAASATQAAKLDLSPAAGLAKQPTNPAMTMEQAAQAFQDYLKSLPSNLQFQPDYEAGIVVFKVVNPVTQKVIRQMPPEAVVQQAITLRLAQKQGHSGILLDEST